MKTHRVAVIAGDGIGPEVIAEGEKALNAAAERDGTFRFEFTRFPWGCEYYLKSGRMMPADALETLKGFDAIFLGAVGHPSVPDHISLRDLLLVIRQGFDQGVRREDIDMVFVRENSEGEYSGQGEWRNEGTPEETAVQYGVFSRRGCERIMRYAYEMARREGRTLTSISKGNALNYSMVFWDKVFREVGAEYPDVETRSLLVDAAAMFMVKDPKRFQIVVASNLFGDILTDLGAAISGGMGLAAGANINPERRFPSMFEPIHGSAPDIAGRGIANPLATVWSASQMLDFLGHGEAAGWLIAAIEKVLSEGATLTPDLGGAARTPDVGDAIAAAVGG